MDGGSYNRRGGIIYIFFIEYCILFFLFIIIIYNIFSFFIELYNNNNIESFSYISHNIIIFFF